jgi:hypothetical protein
VLQAFGVPKEGAAGHKHVGTGAGRAGDRGGGDTTVDLELDVEAALVDEGPRLGDLGLHGGDVGLAAEPGVDRHHQDQVHQIDDVADGLDPGRRVERHSRPGAESPDLAQRLVEMCAGLGVNDDQLAAGLDVAAEEVVGVADHQMRLEPHGRPGPAGGDHVGSEGQVGDEVPVHHVPLDSVDPGLFQGGDVVAEAREIGGQNGGHNQRGAGRHGTDDTHTSWPSGV